MENGRIAGMLEEIGDLLELEKADRFRVRAYRNAARTVRNLSERAEVLNEAGRDLSALPHIGKRTAEKIQEMLETGTCRRLEILRRRVPPQLRELLQIPGLGPQKTAALHEALGIDNLSGLKAACERREVREVEGFGATSENKILRAATRISRTEDRILYRDAEESVHRLSEYLDSIDAIARFEVAGSFRRGKETVGDIDVLVQARDRKSAATAVHRYVDVEEVILDGEERTSVRLEGGLQVDFRFVLPASFGSAMLYFTGAKEHNIRLRRRARDLGFKLNEYGLFKGDTSKAGKTEVAVYKRLGLQWIPPELREDRGEIDAALAGSLPSLLEERQIRGDFQCHTRASDGSASIEEMARAAQHLGRSYLAVTDHSKRVSVAGGLDDDAVIAHAAEIRKVGAKLKRFRLLAGIEVDILKDGSLDLKRETLAQLDWVVASVHYGRDMDETAMTDRVISAVESGVVHCLGHPLGRIIGQREALRLNLDRVFEACAKNDVFVEINCQPDRLDLPDKHCLRALKAGVRFALSTDAHSPSGLRLTPHGVRTARRGWVSGADVLNTMTLPALEKRLGLD